MNSWLPHSRVFTEICSPHRLTQDDFSAMLDLMHRYYRNVKATNFFRDLREKDYVLCLRLQSGDAPCEADTISRRAQRLVGFSTQKLFTVATDRGTVRVLFSGDTIVAREHWNSPHLARLWGRFAMQQIETSPDPLYWFLLSKGFRTYRFLPLFFREYVPGLSATLDGQLEDLRDAIACHLYGQAYQLRTQLVPGDSIDNYAVRPGVADVDEQRLRDPYVQRFLQLNPHHERGDELCCLAPLTVENFTAAARRVIGAPYF